MSRALFTWVLLLPLVGCSSSSLPPQYEFTGSVTIDGTPAPLTNVRFVCAEDDKKSGMVTTKLDGTFSTSLQTGEYKVIFSQAVDRNGKPIMGSGGKKSEAISGEREAVADEYRDTKLTPYSVKVLRGEKQSMQFDVKKSTKKK